MLHQINIQPGKATEQLHFHTCLCAHMFPTLSKYANHYHYNTQICKLVRHAYSELIICIKETYISTNVQLISLACYDIFILIRWSYKATPKIRYWPSIHHVSSNKYSTRKSYKTTPISHLSHAHMYLHVPYIEQIYQ